MTAHDNPVEAIFAELGIPTLPVFLASGADFSAVGLTDDDVANYTRVAAARWYGALPATDMGDHMMMMVVAALSPDGADVHPDGRVTIDTPFGVLEVTEHRLRHWLWVASLLKRRELAEGWLAAVPEAVRAEAMGRAHATVDMSFAGLVEGER